MNDAVHIDTGQRGMASPRVQSVCATVKRTMD